MHGRRRSRRLEKRQKVDDGDEEEDDDQEEEDADRLIDYDSEDDMLSFEGDLPDPAVLKDKISGLCCVVVEVGW